MTFIAIRTLVWEKYPERGWVARDEKIIRIEDIIYVTPWDDGAYKVETQRGSEVISADEYERIRPLLLGETPAPVAPALPADVIDMFRRWKTDFDDPRAIHAMRMVLQAHMPIEP